MSKLYGYDSTNAINRPILCDPSGHLQIDFLNSSMVVDLGATDNAVLDNIDSNTAGCANITQCDTDNTKVIESPTVGAQANASDAVLTSGADEKSNSVDLNFCSKMVAIGNVDGACTITLQQSQNDTDWYSEGTTQETFGAEDFSISRTVAAARYYRLSYSASGVTVTATMSGQN